MGKKREKPKVEYNERELYNFVNGFRKRKLENKKKYEEKLKKRHRAEVLERRAMRREILSEQYNLLPDDPTSLLSIGKKHHQGGIETEEDKKRMVRYIFAQVLDPNAKMESSDSSGDEENERDRKKGSLHDFEGEKTVSHVFVEEL